ncbi:hypothetical protein DTO006G1_2710 [Penicillium roqueforti]|nr:hypothetical protein CBS147337_2728 [Penicillium roqueforti]KAI2762773.1 hypothetical protein DTO006G1_2710 [Penicillium roqueforti]KAI3254691.1 hypothetical protein DTO006G7_4684 [Penicillium roqueforti]
MTITCALAPNLLGFMVCRLLAGTAGSVPLSIGAGSLADMIPSKNRGLAMGARSCAWTRDSAHRCVSPDAWSILTDTAGGYLVVSKAFDAGANGYCRGEGSWDVYTTFDEVSEKKLVNNILVFHPVTGELFAMVMGATFHSVAMKSLVAMLANLNTPGVSLANTQPATNGTKGVKNSQTLNSVHTNLHSTNNRDSGSIVGIEQNLDWILSVLRQLLSSATEIPVNEIAPTTYLANIGIDALMSTEVLSDIRRQFHVDIPISEFIALDTVLAISKFPQHAFEHTLLASTGSKFAECLTRKADLLEIFFGSIKSRALLENVYTNAPMFAAGSDTLWRIYHPYFHHSRHRRRSYSLETGSENF